MYSLSLQKKDQTEKEKWEEFLKFKTYKNVILPSINLAEQPIAKHITHCTRHI